MGDGAASRMWAARRERWDRWKADGRTISTALRASDNTAALRRTVAYFALYGSLNRTQFDAAREQDPILSQAGTASALLEQAVRAGLLTSPPGEAVYVLAPLVREHRDKFVKRGGDNLTDQSHPGDGFLNGRPGKAPAPPWAAGGDLGL